MKIQDQQPRTAAELGITGARASRADERRTAERSANAASGGTGPAATVQLSSRSRELHSALAAVKASPEVRADKVADVRRRLEQGTYVIDPTRIARGILDAKA
jgi:flagellar biosynthesis anti-sigma factor FlgM